MQPEIGDGKLRVRLALLPDGANHRHAASLHDRLCIREGRPQRYGTQIAPGGHPFALEDGDVDARRAGVGLGPLTEYLRQVRP